MNTILSLRTDRYFAKFSVVLIIVALIVGMVGCRSDQDVLTIRCTEGGQVTSPVKSSDTYAAGKVLNLTAEAQEGYRFEGWTGGVSTIAHVNAAVTTITMNGTYSITANFVQGQEIRDWFDLDATRTSDNLGGHHRLMNDLDSTIAGYNETVSDSVNEGKGWQPIGTSDDQFTGSFDGHGYEIRDLSIDRPDESSVGLFGYVAGGGVIEEIRVVNASVTGKDYVGALVGWNQGTVSNSYSDGNVTGTNNYIGGLVGWNQGTISNSYSDGDVTGTDNYVGGLAGWNQDTVRDSYSTASVSGGSWVGGLAAWNQGTVTNSYSDNNVTGSNEHVGGLVGWNEGTVSNSYSSGGVSGDDYVGGLVGDNHDGTVKNSYCTGTVTSDRRVGGLVGYNENSSVSNCYSTGSVTADRYVGGLVGYNEKSSVSKSYSAGRVTGNTYFGGLVGLNNEGTVADSFWDEVTSGTGESAGGKGETTADMRDITTFLNAGWSISEATSPQTNDTCTWKIADGQTYPSLGWQSVS